MNQTETRDQREAKMTAEREASFAKFLAKPETKMIASLIPAPEQPEALQILMKAAFDAGYGSGEGAVAIMMIEAMFKKDQGRGGF